MEVALRNMDEMALRNGENPPPGREARLQRQMERQMGGIRWNIDKWAEKTAGGGVAGNAAGVENMTRVVLAVAPQNPAAAGDKPADWARQLVYDPVYQLK